MNPRRLYPIALAIASLALFCGCQTPVKTEFKPDAGFAAYRSFAMMPLPQTGPANDPGLMLRLARPAQDATAKGLSEKGYQPADRAEADFAVNLRGQSLPKIEVTDWGYSRTTWTRHYGYVPVHAGRVDVRNYEERTLAIEIFDNQSHELVWTGCLTKESSGKITPEKLKEAIRTILAKFPPPSAQPK